MHLLRMRQQKAEVAYPPLLKENPALKLFQEIGRHPVQSTEYAHHL